MLKLITRYRDGRGPMWLYRMLMWCIGPRFMWQMRSHGTQIVRSPCGRIGVKHHKQIWCSYHDAIEADNAHTTH